MSRIFTLIFLTFFLSSCVGFAVVSGENQEYTSQGNMYWIPDKEDIIKKYGQPDDKKQPTETKEIWVYKNEIAFNSIVVGLIIPVPIVYPAGYREIIYEFEDSKLEKVTVERPATTSAFLCGILSLGEGIGGGCYKK